MYFQLTGAIKNRLITELRTFWKLHPRYRDDLPDHIQGKFSFAERPQHGIVVKTGSGNRVDLAADNYVGTVESYIYLTRVKDKPGISVEWVREDSRAIQENHGRFPSQPGIYYVDITESDMTTGTGTFWVDPLLDVYHEPVTMTDETHGQLQHAPLSGTVRVYELPSGFLLREGVNYVLGIGDDGKPDGSLTALLPLAGGRWLQADYRYPSESTGPFSYREMHADNRAIPGCVLAFGRRAEKGDQFAVVVHDIRRPAYLEYGGKWELSLDFDVISRDVYAQQEIADQTVVYLWGILRARLSHQGIEITDVSLGGESEEIYDENGDDYFYNSSFTMTCQTDWSIHVPIDGWIRQVAPLTSARASIMAGLTDDELVKETGDIVGLEALGLENIRDPFWSGRAGTFELVR